MADTREPVEAAGPAPSAPLDPPLAADATDGHGAAGTPGPSTGRHRRPSSASPVLASMRELVPLVVAALALAVLIKSFLVQAFFIPSVSMEPTLLPGDRILVCRICTLFDDVTPGDVIVFSDPNPGPETDRGVVGGFLHWLWEGIGVARPEHDDFIKRVVAVGGDTWEISDGGVFVNGSRIEEPYLATEPDTRDFGPEVVPDGMLFVLGDNRAHSGDSRFPPPAGLGYVPEEDVIGEAFVIAWPLDRIGGIG